MNKVQNIQEFKGAANAVSNNEEYELIERVVMQGDLSQLTAQQRVTYYRKVCESSGLNPYTRPFDYIILNGKLTLYAKKDATEQLRKLNGISIDKIESKIVEDLYIVKATATMKDGRKDEATGAVSIANLKGNDKANALMKAETKAKRRVTLSISGMGWTDETEIETIPGAKKPNICIETGEISMEKPVSIETIKASQAQAFISLDQANELKSLLEKCSADFNEKFIKTLCVHKIASIDEMPIAMYDRAKFSAVAGVSAAKASQNECQ